MYVRVIWQSGYTWFQAATRASTICSLPPVRSHIFIGPPSQVPTGWTSYWAGSVDPVDSPVDAGGVVPVLADVLSAPLMTRPVATANPSAARCTFIVPSP